MAHCTHSRHLQFNRAVVSPKNGRNGDGTFAVLLAWHGLWHIISDMGDEQEKLLHSPKM